MQENYYVTNFYHFFDVSNSEATKTLLESKALELDAKGLIILANEGFNGTVCFNTKAHREIYEDLLQTVLTQSLQKNTGSTQLKKMVFKHSDCTKNPFNIFKVKLRPEIVTLNTPDLVPNKKNKHLSPLEWNKVLKSDEDYVLIDTRNWYETKIGKFKGALDPKIDQFTDFPKYLEDNNIPKDKKVLIYCTGGIRCEKGLLEMERMGYQDVNQLDGGILKYFEEYPNDEFEGECFVFDHRVAVNQELAPTKNYDLCPHTGQPANNKIVCSKCEKEAKVSDEILNEPIISETCSKDCAYHLHRIRTQGKDLDYKSKFTKNIY